MSPTSVFFIGMILLWVVLSGKAAQVWQAMFGATNVSPPVNSQTP